MCGSLKKNMFPTPDFALNSDVEGFSKIGSESGVDNAMACACRSWYNHLRAVVTEHLISDALPALRRFLEKYILRLEVWC
jgi:hypothetical protein